jgi:26S proteasome regulatory subunit N12
MADAATLFQTFKKTFEAEPCDLAKCEELLGQLKLLAFPSLASGKGASGPEQKMVVEMLELACFLSIRKEDMTGFDRHVAQLKMYYNDIQKGMPSDQKFKILGLYLLHLLASDRIGEFHTELELIAVDDHENQYIKQPIQLERHIMEGNYSKILEAKNTVPQKYCTYFMDRLEDTVRTKIGASLERSYTNLPVQEAAKMLILTDVGKLQEFAIAENERKQRESEDDDMGDITPSISRRMPTSICKWEVKDGRLYFTRSAEKRPEVWEEMMVNTIGYATDLERIV